VILCKAGLSQCYGHHLRDTKRNLGGADGVPIPQVSCFRYFENLTHRVWRKAFFCKLALALQRQLEGVRKIQFGLFDGFALRNRGGKLFHKTSVATLFGGFKNGGQFHARRLSHLTNGQLQCVRHPPLKIYSRLSCSEGFANKTDDHANDSPLDEVSNSLSQSQSVASPVCIPAMSDSGDFYGVIVPQLKKYPVIAAAQSESGKWRLEFFYITNAAAQEAIDAIEDLHRWFASKSREGRLAQPSTTEPPSAEGPAVRSFAQAKLAKDFLMGNAFSAVQRFARAMNCGDCVRAELFLFYRHVCEKFRQGLKHGLQQAYNCRKLPRLQLINQLDRAFFGIRH